MGVSVMATVAAVNEAQQSLNPPVSGGQTAGGLALAVAVGTIPIWRQWLALTSELAAEVAPILGALIAVATLWRSLRGKADRMDGKATPAGTAGKLAGAAAAAARRSPLVAAAVAAVAVSAAFLWASKARAEPAIPPAAAQTAKGRRKSADDAGEDGTLAASAGGKGDPPWLVSARTQLGVREWKGKRHNPAIVQWFADSGHPEVKDDETANCAAFVGAHLSRAGLVGSKSLAARSYLRWGAECEPKPGAVVVLWRGSPASWQGHVGFWVGEDATHVHVLGSNQGDAVSVARFAKSRVLGYRWPKRAVDKKALVAGVASATAGGGAVVAVANGPPDAASGPAMPASPPPALEAVQAIKGPLAELGAVWRPAAIAAAALGIACALYVVWHATRAR